jgi:hypothetical protein
MAVVPPSSEDVGFKTAVRMNVEPNRNTAASIAMMTSLFSSNVLLASIPDVNTERRPGTTLRASVANATALNARWDEATLDQARA